MDIKDIEKAYPEATLMVAMAESVWNGNNTSIKMELSISDRLQAEFHKLLGTDVQTIFITDSDIRHIKKQHGQRESLRGQIDIQPEDFALVPLGTHRNG
jgi:hypothetical protein